MNRMQFIYSIANEIIVDESYLRRSGLFNKLRHPVIKYYAIPNLLQKHPYLLRYCLIFFNKYIWWIIYFIDLSFFIQLIIKKIIFKNKINQQITTTRIFVNTSPQLIAQYKKCKFKYTCYSFLIFNKKDKYKLKKENCIYYLDILSIKEIWRCCINALKEVKNVRKTYGIFYSLHACKAIKWYLVQQALCNLPVEEFVFCNHYDRWALLLASYDNRKKILIQHGILDGVIKIKNKVKNIDTLYCFNNEQSIFFKEIIESISEIKFISNEITLKPITRTTNKSILLIGNVSVYKELEFFFIQKFSKIIDKFTLYVKPHPVFPFNFYKKLKLKKYPFILISQKDFFPQVDFVISYRSTLAYEYELNGIKVFYYDNMDKQEILDIIISN